jgi:6-phosphogluconolactonase
LLVVGQMSHHLSRWTIDQETGQLELHQRIPVGQGPNWVEILA